MADSDSIDDKPHAEIHTDEDWKTRVKEEDAKRDAEAQAAQQASTESATEGANAEPSGEVAPESATSDGQGKADFDPSELPPASLFTLMQMLSTQAIVALGMIPAPNGKTVVEVEVAKHFIDLLSVIEEKTKGNLSSDESKFLDGTLHELRMAYVNVSRQQRG